MALTCMALTGCNEFLDRMPDNRATLDSEEKIQAILTSAYLTHDQSMAPEISSDNTDDIGEKINHSWIWSEDMWHWRDEQETPNESLKSLWNDCYISISSANEALAAIEKMEPTAKLRMLKGEALMCRAYLHFTLANIFCHAWDKNAQEKMGLPYMTAPETQLIAKHDRGNLSDLYKHIEADLEAGLKLVGDSYYTVPKYHFNTKAAYAFACRFYLYTEQWEKALEYADLCLGSDPRSVLRDYNELANLNQTLEVLSRNYIAANHPCNLLIHPTYSRAGQMYGNSTSYGRYNHSQCVASTEDITAPQIYGDKTSFRWAPATYTSANNQKSTFLKIPDLFEYTDLVQGTGYRHSAHICFTTDECLLNRAEAKILLRRYDEAATDLTMWMQNITKSTLTLTPDTIQGFYTNKVKEYSYSDAQRIVGTQKKHLNPSFAIDKEGSVQESMLQCVLTFRRIESLSQGLRWYDIKRYGIEIPRRQLDMNHKPAVCIDFLTKDDERRALQLPASVISAGVVPNKRDGKNY